jgi:hypothetical protein
MMRTISSPTHGTDSGAGADSMDTLDGARAAIAPAIRGRAGPSAGIAVDDNELIMFASRPGERSPGTPGSPGSRRPPQHGDTVTAAFGRC